jgi:large subunit ribosomal protein L9
MGDGMKVILRQDYEPLGKIGARLEVKAGYARNFLIPRGLVYPATGKYEGLLEAEKKLVVKRLQHQMKGAKELADRLGQTAVVIRSKAGEEGKLFGSVTSQDIAAALLEQGLEMDRRKIILDEPIRLLGTYQVRVHLQAEVNALLQVTVLKEA